MLPILITATNERQVDAAVAWDPIAGNPVASFSGEVITRGTLTSFSKGIVGACARKPFIQTWSFQTSAMQHKNILTKSPVSAFIFTPDESFIFIAFDKDINIYQVTSGCLITVLEGCHSSKIGQLKLFNWSSFGPTFLVSSDVSGFVACWSLGCVLSDASYVSLCSVEKSETEHSFNTESDYSVTKHSPLWYVMQASSGLASCEFTAETVLICGSQGLKIYDLYTGSHMSTLFSETIGGIHCFTVMETTGSVFCGANDGILCTGVIKPSEKLFADDKEPHRCFTDAGFSSIQKAIVSIALCLTNDILVVGARCGLIEVLRPNCLLVCLQRFSIFNPSVSTDTAIKPELTGLCLASRPDWLNSISGVTELESKPNVLEPEQHKEVNTAESRSAPIEPLKRQIGWGLDDTVLLQLVGNLERSDISHELTTIYLDDYFSNFKSNGPKFDRSAECDALKKELDQAIAANRELTRRLIEYELRS